MLHPMSRYARRYRDSARRRQFSNTTTPNPTNNADAKSPGVLRKNRICLAAPAAEKTRQQPRRGERECSDDEQNRYIIRRGRQHVVGCGAQLVSHAPSRNDAGTNARNLEKSGAALSMLVTPRWMHPLTAQALDNSKAAPSPRAYPRGSVRPSRHYWST
jgi:hypothetical protein